MKARGEIRALANKQIAKNSLRFFKTGKGAYGHGDLFLGVKVPKIRLIAKKHTDTSITEMKKLICSKYHEERLLGLIILVNKYSKNKDRKTRNQLYKIYVSSFKYINNWDLVDVTCPHVIGKHLKGIHVCSTGLIVKGLARPEMLMEIDIEAIIPDDENE